MIYCDTSLLVAALTPEASSLRADAWLRQRPAGEICISPWVITEFSSAIALKVRFGSLPAEFKGEVLTRWRAMQADQLLTIAVPQEAFNLAARFCDLAAAGLRASDALHLAIASSGGHSLATLDQRMGEAALVVGVRVEEI